MLCGVCGNGIEICDNCGSAFSNNQDIYCDVHENHFDSYECFKSYNNVPDVDTGKVYGCGENDRY